MFSWPSTLGHVCKWAKGVLVHSAIVLSDESNNSNRYITRVWKQCKTVVEIDLICWPTIVKPIIFNSRVNKNFWQNWIIFYKKTFSESKAVYICTSVYMVYIYRNLTSVAFRAKPVPIGTWKNCRRVEWINRYAMVWLNSSINLHGLTRLNGSNHLARWHGTRLHEKAHTRHEQCS